MQNLQWSLNNLQPVDLDARQVFSGRPSGTRVKGYASPSAYTPAIDPNYVFHEASRDVPAWFVDPQEPLYVFGPTGCGKTSCIKGAGSTPLAPALWWTMQAMLPLRESRKIVLILTDGEPDEVTPCLAAIRQAERMGMEVLGIGIQHTAIKELLPNTSRIIVINCGVSHAAEKKENI